MPRNYAKRVPRKVKRKGRKGARKSRIPRSIVPKKQFASITETIEFAELLPNTSYAGSFNIAQFARASTIACNFKWYKAAMIRYSYEPLYNTYQEDPTVPHPTIPYFYLSMNRTQSARSQNLYDYQAEGVRPVKFVNKIVKSYKPNWCSMGLITYNPKPVPGSSPFVEGGMYANGLKAEYGWLMSPETLVTNNTGQFTSPLLANNQAQNGMAGVQSLPINTSQVVYNGHSVFIEQNNAPSGAVVCKVTATVHWVFKDAMNYSGLSGVPPTQAMTQKDTDPNTTRGDQPSVDP